MSHHHTAVLAAGLFSGLLTLQGCDAATSPVTPQQIAGSTGAMLDADQCALTRPGFSLRSTNAHFPLGVGSSWLLEGRQDRADIRLRIAVLDETEDVGGVTTRVLEEREWIDGELSEVARNFFAEASDGTVCYFGEAVDFYENGEIVSHEGTWRADAPGNRPGIIMPADPEPGITFQMEGAPGVAEDEGTILRSGGVRVPAGLFRETIRVREFNPLDGGTGVKTFAEGVGMVLDGRVGLVEYRVAR